MIQALKKCLQRYNIKGNFMVKNVLALFNYMLNSSLFN